MGIAFLKIRTGAVVCAVLAAAVFACAARAAEPALQCQWTNPNTGRQAAFAFYENPLIIATAGQNITLSAAAHGVQGQVTVFKGAQPIRTGASVALTAPDAPGAYYIPLAVEAAGMRRETEICVFVPHKAVGRVVANGWDLTVDGESVGNYRNPAKSGNAKVRGNPDSYMPPPWWLRVTPMNAQFAVVPGLTAGELVVASEDTGEQHTDLVPVCYPMWTAILTVRQEMERRGIPAGVMKLISMFRAPAYNRGVGSNAYGRHVYGDSFDFYIDLENDGKASDLNRDGKRDRRDAYPIVAMIEDLQDDGKIPMGGIGVYNSVAGDHEVTMHLDMRGHRATWGFLTSASGKKSEFSWASRRFAELDRHEENLAAERAAKEGRKYARPNREPLP